MLRHRRISNLALAVAASLVVFGGLLVSDASAHGRARVRTVHSHSRAHVTYVVRRPVVFHPGVWAFRDPAPLWCRDGRYVEYDGSPYWYHVGLGMYFGGVDVNVDLGNAPPRGYGYWDPCRSVWVSDLRAYSFECRRLHRVPALRVVRLEGRPGWRW
jgi:hypothetical protein